MTRPVTEPFVVPVERNFRIFHPQEKSILGFWKEFEGRLPGGLSHKLFAFLENPYHKSRSHLILAGVSVVSFGIDSYRLVLQPFEHLRSAGIFWVQFKRLLVILNSEFGDAANHISFAETIVGVESLGIYFHIEFEYFDRLFEFPRLQQLVPELV